jgi:ABC-type glycerol-3-phosphate transport system permease component
MFAILFVTSFIGHWNDYMTMIVWLPSKPSLAYGMYRFQYLTGKDLTWPPIQVAGCVILMLPVLALFIALKDKILGGVTIGTLK